MRNYRLFLLVPALLLVASSLACGPKKLAGPPQALLDDMAAVEKYYADLAPLSPKPEDSAKYNTAIQAAKDALARQDYKLAAEKTKLARLEAVRLGGMLEFRQLEAYHPAPPLTYYYRQHLKTSEDAQAAGKMDEAIAAAMEARKQAGLALDLQKQCMEDITRRLAAGKAEIEHIYRADWTAIQLYWKAQQSLPAQDCEQTKKLVAEMEKIIQQTKASTISQTPTFIVTAPPEFVRIYGDPIMFQEVTTEGLKTRLGRVAVGTQVNFVQSLMVAPNKNYYLVEDPGTGMKGWMAEERVWPERAMMQKSSQP